MQRKQRVVVSSVCCSAMKDKLCMTKCTAMTWLRRRLISGLLMSIGAEPLGKLILSDRKLDPTLLAARWQEMAVDKKLQEANYEKINAIHPNTLLSSDKWLSTGGDSGPTFFFFDMKSKPQIYSTKNKNQRSLSEVFSDSILKMLNGIVCPKK